MRVLPIICVATVTFGCSVAGAQTNRIDSQRSSNSAALTTFWTEQRLRDAQPMPLASVDPGSAGGQAEPKAVRQRSSQAKQPPASGATRAQSTMRPHWWSGKLFFAATGGAVMTCAADLIAPGIVLTAAHCLRDSNNGQWFTNMLYVFDYQRDSGRRIPPDCTAAYSAWVAKDASRWPWDYGLVKIRGGTNIGHFGYELGWWGKQETAALVSGRVDRPDRPVPSGSLVKGWNDKIVGLKLDSGTTALSGGGWIARYQETGADAQSNRALSVSSHHQGDDRSTVYGPYWDESFTQLLAHAQRGCR